MPGVLTSYRIFIATPGGLDEERRAFRDCVVEFNDDTANPRGVHFIPVGWEETLGGDRRAQSLINDDLRACDYFVMALWNRWGSPTQRGTKPKYEAGTHEEYCVAEECLNDDQTHMRHRVVFFKQLTPEELAAPNTQTKKVLTFKKQLERERNPLFHTFDELRSFERWMRKFLNRWLADHEDQTLGKVVEPEPDVERETLAPQETSEPEQQAPPSDLLAEAERLADAGEFVEAERCFALAVVDGDDPDALNRYGHFQQNFGRLAAAEGLYQRVLDLANATDDDVWRAKAYGNLGLIDQTRGELERAEELLRKALEINERLGLQEGMATQYGNLGGIHRRRGELERAAEMWTKSRDLFQAIGMPDVAQKVQGWLDELADNE